MHSEFFQGMYYWSFKNILIFSCEKLGCLICFFLYCLMLRWFLGTIFYKLFQNKVHTYTELNILHRQCQIYFEKKSTAWVLLGIKDETIVSHTHAHTHTNLFQNGNIFEKSSWVYRFRKMLVLEWSSFKLRGGSWLTEYRIPLNNLLILRWMISLMWAAVAF